MNKPITFITIILQNKPMWRCKLPQRSK